MEAKIKALELMQRFNEPTMQWDELDGFIPHKHNAKTCALIAVDEILKELKEIGKRFPITSSPFNYYEQVKNEIEKL
jgi:hypothetical protein